MSSRKIIDTSLRLSLVAILYLLAQDVKIGAILWLSGANAYYGQLIKRGCELASEEIGDQKLNLLFEDSQ